ncbi:TrmH family RNA methyltransferase [Leeuwenhoekiella sp. MAR_2009_132]|uniref:TrmH family RNA methyltransferase n=1 Tax=Leeuwenhoekiella sp. MAR_2009_132 TaxID=1392489 RepID=UPI00048FDB36|nr:TrmH family RNA methyltransferase [Leeuwenhoekiella sp. MAR_2009_132]
MKTEQLTHNTTLSESGAHDLVLICDGISSPANAGSLMRLSDALGVKHLYFCNSTINFESSRFKRTSRSTEMYVPYTQTSDCDTILEKLMQENYTLLGLELTNNSISLTDFNMQANEKIALILGNERHGISASVLTKLNKSIYIPMYGKNSSMNVAQAAAIAAYTLINNRL